MSYDKQSAVSMGASVDIRQDVPVGTMVRKSMYLVQNYSPMSLDEITNIVGESLIQNHLSDIREIMVARDDEMKVPLGKFTELLGEDLSFEAYRKLFSKPVWEVESPNLVVTVGLNDSLDKHFKASSYTAAWYVGLVSGTPTFAAADTMASHAGWFEVLPYAGARPTLTLGSVTGTGSIDNSANKAVYSINATMVVGGAFVNTLPTAGQTSGTLYGGAAFSGGNRSVASGDTLNVTVTLTAAAA